MPCKSERGGGGGGVPYSQMRDSSLILDSALRPQYQLGLGEIKLQSLY